MTTTSHTGGWLRMTRHAYGLSIEDLAFILDVNRDHIRKVWERGNAPIPDGVIDEIDRFIAFTDTIVDMLTDTARINARPALIVYRTALDIPRDQIAAAYGPTWWDHIAHRVISTDPSVFVGSAIDVADYLSQDRADHEPLIPVSDVHELADTLTMRCPTGEADRRVRARHNEPPIPEWA